MTKDKHIIIIGSGLGGLTCGYILAKKGYKITILEQNAQIGGCLQTFKRAGTTFETGMHYIGSMDEGQILNRFFSYFNMLDTVPVSRLDPNGYDVILLEGQRFPIVNGEENFVDTLSQFFPHERSNLKVYSDYINKITDYSMFYTDNAQMTNSTFLRDPAFVRSASEFIETTIQTPLLRDVLAGNLPLYGGVENKTPLYIHALIHDFYNKSAFRVAGGSDIIASSLANSIKEMGGEVLTRHKVVKINCDDMKATSVLIDNNVEIHADYIISNAHPVRTLELLDTPMIRKSFRNRVNSIENTISNFTVYIRFKENALPYQNYNLYYSPKANLWKHVGNYRPEQFPLGFLYMHCCAEQNQKFAHNGILLSYMNFDEVAKWRGTRIERRGDDYQEFKHNRAELLLDMLEEKVPGTRANILDYYTSSPLTYLDYTGTEGGSMYGILPDCNNLLNTKVLPRTKVPNLLLTGQNINIHGILGVMIGAVITARELTDTSDIIQHLHNK